MKGSYAEFAYVCHSSRQVDNGRLVVITNDHTNITFPVILLDLSNFLLS